MEDSLVSFALVSPASDSAHRGVRRCHHRLPPGRFLRLLRQAPSPGPEAAGDAEGLRDAADGHLGHGLHHQLRRHHDPQHPLRARGHLDHQLR